MNSTNRAANRLFILIIGIVLVVLGAAAVLLGTLAPVRSTWRDVAGTARKSVTNAFTTTTIPGTTMNWIGIAVLVLLAIVVVVLVVFIVRQGNGHTSVALDESDGDDRTVIDTSVVRDVLTDLLGRRPELVSTSVGSYRVRRTTVLKIAATCRRGVAPTDAASIIEDALARLDRLVGREVPALIELSGGFRARVAATTRLQ
jgi:hypothetical protein